MCSRIRPFSFKGRPSFKKPCQKRGAKMHFSTRTEAISTPFANSLAKRPQAKPSAFRSPSEIFLETRKLLKVLTNEPGLWTFPQYLYFPDSKITTLPLSYERLIMLRILKNGGLRPNDKGQQSSACGPRSKATQAYNVDVRP